MEINQLRYFLAVTEYGSFSKAAERCYVTQSTLSELIQKLENEVGRLLLDRSRRRIVPTDAGKLLVGRAKRILTQVEIAKREIKNSDGTKSGKIAFGILPTIAPYLLPHALVNFQKAFPKIQFTIHENLTAHLLQQLEENKLDFAIASLPIKERGYDIEELFIEELQLALQQKHPLCAQNKISMEDLHRENFILLHEGHCLGDQILDFCNRHDFSPQISLRSGQIATIQSLIQAGVGISLIPEMAVEENSSHIVYRSLERPRPKRSIVIVTREKRPMKIAALDFIKHLRHVVKMYVHTDEKAVV